MNVNEVMSSAVKTCRPASTLEEVARMMWEGDCGAIPVVTENEKPLGIVTDRDIAMAAMLNHQPLWEIPASKVIEGQELCCCDQHETLENCLNMMEESEVRRILVIDRTGKLAGILSMGDALAFTRAESSRRKSGTVSVEPVLGMLRKVSGHHSPERLPLHIN